ncbi:MAG: carboxylating nicotinate-nucleotide diphosphorylase [Ruminococcus sp.]|nr:carboxylating nicotinate-nucleotide diphosphorylase [Ruminococcus sp.]
MKLLNSYIDDLINRALLEDIIYIDIATDYLIPETHESTAFMVAKDNGVLAGIDVAMRVFGILDPKVQVTKLKNDGDNVSFGEKLVNIHGNTAALLKGERTALNILQHMSGIATAVAKLQSQCEGTNCHICETRKTLPGLRTLEKYAVLCGGGRNHRFNLSDAAMIKDNHIDAYGGLRPAVETLRKKIGHMNRIEVEVRNLKELNEALDCGCEVIMLDNMTPALMKECVEIVNKRAILEASGNITIENVREVAKTGVDVISIGAITHSVKAFDISMKIGEKNDDTLPG